MTSLSARLLVLTIFFVMLAEVFIYVPSIANFRLAYHEARIAASHIATLALEAAPDYMYQRRAPGAASDPGRGPRGGAQTDRIPAPGLGQRHAA
jgi:hypothetical protein